MHTVLMLVWLFLVDIALLFFIFVLMKSFRVNYAVDFASINEQVSRGERARAPFLILCVWIVTKQFGFRRRIFGLLGSLMILTASIMATVHFIGKLAH